MAKTYRMVRLSSETHRQLQILQAAFQQSNMEAKTELPEHDQFGVTLDTVVRELIEREWSHRLRAGRKSRPQSVREALGEKADPEGSITFWNGSAE